MSAETRIVVMGDNHGNHADQDTLEAVLDFCKDFKPHYRVHLGDNWDLACLRKGVGQQDKEAAWSALEDDIQQGIDWLRRYRPSHYLWGNHCWRLKDAMHSTDSITKLDALKDIDAKLTKAIRQSGAKVVKPYTVHDGFADIGPLTFTHGFFHGNDAVLKMAHRFNSGPGHGLVMGHLHRAEQHNLERRGGGAVWICGAACDLKLQYAEKRPSSLRWQNSFMAFIVKGEHYIGRQAHRFNGRWIMPFAS